MNKYKLGNLSKKSLLKNFKNSEIKKCRFSFSYLNKLCESYPIIEYVTDSYCCRGEDFCCWQDEDCGWLRAANKHLSTYEINRLIYSSFKKSFNKKATRKEVDLSKRNVFIGEDENCVVFSIPLRDIYREDLCFVFHKVPFETYDK